MSSRKVLDSQMKQKSPMSGNTATALKSRTLPQFAYKSGSFIDDYEDDDEDDEDSDNFNHEKMKTMFMSMWNNVKYGFATKLKTKFNYESPIWLLGECYHKRMTDSLSNSDHHRSDPQCKLSAMDRFKHDFYSRIWMTYRREFPKLSNSHLTTDCGWGCMLRSGQMILGHAFLTHYLGRQWRWSGPQSDKEDMIHRMIIKWFGDDPNAACSPFSVHQLVKCGEQMGKKAGDWFGPASVAHLIRIALNYAAAANPVLNNICCYVAQDCTVYIQDVIELCTANSVKPHDMNLSLDKQSINSSYRHSSSTSSDIEVGVIANESTCNDDRELNESFACGPSLRSYGKAPSTFNLTDNSCFNSGPRSLPFCLAQTSVCGETSKNKWRSVIILVPVRLGSDRLNPIYIPCVKELLAHPSCLGIIGGKPKHSLYFIGWQDDKLIYIDPHYCQQSVDVRQTNFPVDSFHCDVPRKTSFTCMDPSCTIGFYCRTREHFFEFVNTVQKLLIPPNQNGDYPIFVFNEGTDATSNDNVYVKREDKLLRIRHRLLDSQGKVEKEFNGEEFVML